MNILDLDVLAVRLRDEQISEREKLNYLFLLMAMSLFVGAPNLVSIVRRPLWLLIYGALLAVGVIGIVASYRTNRRGDNRSFVERFVIIAAPVSVRVVGLLFGTSIVVTQLGLLRNFDYATRVLIYGALQVLLYALGFVWIRSAMSIASSGPLRTSAIVKGVTSAVVTRKS